METFYFLGIDISKKTFNAALTVDGVNMYETEEENKPQMIQAYFKDLQEKFRFSPDNLIVCMEHTGIYCLPVLDYLSTNKVKVCVEPALQIKQSQGIRRGKTDQIDAKRIAQYAYKNRQELKLWKPQRSVIQKLKALLVLRERLVGVKVQIEVPLMESEDFIEESIGKEMIKHCKKTLKTISEDIDRVEDAIDKIVKEDEQIKAQMAWATSVPGIGKITAMNMIISTGEFERISETKKFACYAGVSPFQHTSGTSVRGRTRVSKLANMTMKRLLHMAAMSAIQCCAEIKAFYQRKVAEGKNKMSVINAVRNKLISRVFSCIKNKRLYQKDYQHALA
jgi:transposase